MFHTVNPHLSTPGSTPTGRFIQILQFAIQSGDRVIGRPRGLCRMAAVGYCLLAGSKCQDNAVAE